MDITYIPLKIVNDCIVIDDGQGLLFDMGSPLSFHRNGEIIFNDRHFPVPTSLIEINCEILNEMVGNDVHGILGMNIIDKFPLTISLRDNILLLNDNRDYPVQLRHASLLVDNMLCVKVRINGRDATMIVDNGAPVSYIDKTFVANLQSVGVANDFSPYCGHFETKLYELETDLSVSVIKYKQSFGTPPDVISLMLSMLGADGILGLDLFRRFNVQLKNNSIYLQQFND